MECKKVSVSVFVCLYYKICRDSFIVCACVCVAGGGVGMGGGGGGGAWRHVVMLCV